MTHLPSAFQLTETVLVLLKSLTNNLRYTILYSLFLRLYMKGFITEFAPTIITEKIVTLLGKQEFTNCIRYCIQH